MAEKDKASKSLEDYNDVFADIYNTLVFKKVYLNEVGLQSSATESIYKADTGEMRGQFRDILKTYCDKVFRVASLGIENQSNVDKYMPVRIMGYDHGTYSEQIKNHQSVVPVITIVLNFSNKPWNEAKSLYELMEIPEELKGCVQNYKIMVYDVAYLEDEIIESFTSDFKVVARFFKERRLHPDKRILADDATPIKHVEAVMDLFRVFTGDVKYKEGYEAYIKCREEKGEEITMCGVLDAYINYGINKGKEEGREEGREEIVLSFVKDGTITADRAADILKCPISFVLSKVETEGSVLQ